jgi:hypothetical protein
LAIVEDKPGAKEADVPIFERHRVAGAKAEVFERKVHPKFYPRARMKARAF